MLIKNSFWSDWIIDLAGPEAHASLEDCRITVINYKANVIRQGKFEKGKNVAPGCLNMDELQWIS